MEEFDPALHFFRDSTNQGILERPSQVVAVSPRSSEGDERSPFEAPRDRRGDPTRRAIEDDLRAPEHDERIAGEAKRDRAFAEGKFEPCAGAETGPEERRGVGASRSYRGADRAQLGDDAADEVPNMTAGHERACVTRRRDARVLNIAADGQPCATLDGERERSPPEPDIDGEERSGDRSTHPKRRPRRKPKPNTGPRRCLFGRGLGPIHDRLDRRDGLHGSREGPAKERGHVEGSSAHEKATIPQRADVARPGRIGIHKLRVGHVPLPHHETKGDDKARVSALFKGLGARARARDNGVAEGGLIWTGLRAGLPLVDEAHRPKALGDSALGTKPGREEEHRERATQRKSDA